MVMNAHRFISKSCPDAVNGSQEIFWHSPSGPMSASGSQAEILTLSKFGRFTPPEADIRSAHL
jgi:hypothetical protein